MLDWKRNNARKVEMFVLLVLNGFDVHVDHDEMRCECVTSVVKSEIFNSRSVDRCMELLSPPPTQWILRLFSDDS